MAITAAVAAVGSVAVGAAGVYYGNKNAKAAQGLGKDQASQQRYFAQQLIDLQKDPSAVFEDPTYKTLFSQGTQAVERSQAAKGFTGSGNAAIELQSWGQNFAHSYLTQQENLLASLSGGSFNPATAMGVGQAGQNDSFDQMSKVLASLGYSMGGMGGGGAGSGANSGMTGGSTPAYTDTGGGFSTGGGYIVNLPGGP